MWAGLIDLIKQQASVWIYQLAYLLTIQIVLDCRQVRELAPTQRAQLAVFLNLAAMLQPKVFRQAYITGVTLLITSVLCSPWTQAEDGRLEDAILESNEKYITYRATLASAGLSWEGFDLETYRAGDMSGLSDWVPSSSDEEEASDGYGDFSDE